MRKSEKRSHINDKETIMATFSREEVARARTHAIFESQAWFQDAVVSEREGNSEYAEYCLEQALVCEGCANVLGKVLKRHNLPHFVFSEEEWERLDRRDVYVGGNN